MEVSFESMIYYFVFIDALFVTIIAWSGRGNSFNEKLGLFSRYFPITRGWTLYYLVLVLWIGYALSRLSVL